MTMTVLNTQELVMDRRTIGLRIRELREAQGLSQIQLANLAGTTQGTITRWESGLAEPLVTSLLAVAVALGVDINEFFTEPTTEYQPRGRGRPPAPKPPEQPPPTAPRRPKK